MDDRVGTEARDDGMTGGSDSRPPRDLRSPKVVDLPSEAAALFDEPAWAERDRNSRTVVATPRMRIMVTALRAGTEVGSEGNDDTLSVQVLRGHVRLELEAGSADLAEGHLATMAEPGRWRLRADEDALLLLTVALGSDR